VLIRTRLLIFSENARGSEAGGRRPGHRQRRLVKGGIEGMTGGAFHRQGPFVGSGGYYRPGPATAAPLLAMKEPLDDAITSPWAFFPISLRCGPE